MKKRDLSQIAVLYKNISPSFPFSNSLAPFSSKYTLFPPPHKGYNEIKKSEEFFTSKIIVKTKEEKH